MYKHFGLDRLYEIYYNSIPIGLAIRQYGNERMKLYAKDVICTAIIYWGFRFLFTKERKRAAFYALIFRF